MRYRGRAGHLGRPRHAFDRLSFFVNDTATTEIYTLSLHDALPICAKGRAAPELVYHRERLTYPLRRTRAKGDRDPGWERIGWDEALDLTAAAMRRIAERHGPESVAFSMSSPSTTAIADSTGFIRRLMNGFGSPNAVTSLDLCGW